MEQNQTKRGRGRPSKQKNSGVGVSSSPTDMQKANANNNLLNSGEVSPIGDIEMVESVGKMENPDLRNAMGMKLNQKGVRVRRVEPTAPAAQFLTSSDILLSFDEIDIANDGTVPFRRGERIGFSYLVSQKYTGEHARVRILRDSKYLEFNVELSTHKRLVPAHIKGKPPSYYIIAGFVFSAVSVPYLRSEYGKDYDYDAPVKLLDKLLHSMAQTEDEQLVLVADINIGYEDIVNTQVSAFNGVHVKNLKHLALMVENCEDEFLQFELEYQQMYSQFLSLLYKSNSLPSWKAIGDHLP